LEKNEAASLKVGDEIIGSLIIFAPKSSKGDFFTTIFDGKTKNDHRAKLFRKQLN